MNKTHHPVDASETFKQLLQQPSTIFYMDTCFAAEQIVAQKTHHCGLDFIANMMEDIRTSGKHITLMKYVVNELRKKKREEWSKIARRFIKDNTNIFHKLPKTISEEELDMQDFRQGFADEALRRQFLNEISNGLIPVLLTADVGCAQAVQSLDSKVQVFFINRHNENRPAVWLWKHFETFQKNEYVTGKLQEQLDSFDVILTSSALQNRNLPQFLEMLALATPEGKKQPVYIHKLSLQQPYIKFELLKKVEDKIFFVDDGDFANETKRLIALYQGRNKKRRVMLVTGNKNFATTLKEELEKSATSHINGRIDPISYYKISVLGRLVPAIPFTKQENSYTIPTTERSQTNGEFAAEAILKAAQKGDRKAMGVVACMHEYGLYLPQSDEMAQEWRHRMQHTDKEPTSPSTKTILHTNSVTSIAQFIQNKIKSYFHSLIITQ